MQKQYATSSSYQFKRSPHGGLIQVLNDGLYVMAEYSERTGVVKWQRVVLTSQREQIEQRLSEQYPAQTTQPQDEPRQISRGHRRNIRRRRLS
jgi:hypothetical protein